MINPYNGVNWNSVQKVCSVSHQHSLSHEYGKGDATIQNLYNKGIRHIALSNYYPSKPCYPMSAYCSVAYDDLLMSPNAEHHALGGKRVNGGTLGNGCHINSIGSLFESGSPSGEEPYGYGKLGWTNAFDGIIAQMQYADAGGITINHPEWSNLSLDLDDILAMLDYSPRVLGIEIYNYTSEKNNQNGWSLDWWDAILRTGRKCWGFCVPDHGGEIADSYSTGEFSGRNVLLVDSFTEYDCLKAYADGRFYGKLNETDFHFSKITNESGYFTVAAPSAEYINIIIDGVYTRYEGEWASVYTPYNATYIRAEAHRSDDSLFTNPIIILEEKKKRLNFPIFFGD